MWTASSVTKKAGSRKNSATGQQHGNKVVRRQHRGALSAVAENGVLLFWVGPALEQAATIGEARQAYTEDDCCCDYEFLHRILCFIVVF